MAGYLSEKWLRAKLDAEAPAAEAKPIGAKEGEGSLRGSQKGKMAWLVKWQGEGLTRIEMERIQRRCEKPEGQVIGKYDVPDRPSEHHKINGTAEDGSLLGENDETTRNNAPLESADPKYCFTNDPSLPQHLPVNQWKEVGTIDPADPKILIDAMDFSSTSNTIDSMPAAEQHRRLNLLKPSTRPWLMCQRCHALVFHQKEHDSRSELVAIRGQNPSEEDVVLYNAKYFGAGCTEATKMKLENGSSGKIPKPMLPATANKESIVAWTAEDQELIRNTLRGDAVILKIVDLLDAPLTMLPDLYEILEARRPIILVGNKADLLTRQTDKFMAETKEWLTGQAIAAGLKDHLLSTHIISAQDGYGIQELVEQMAKISRERKAHVVVIGCTNVGKSRFWNMLREYKNGDLKSTCKGKQKPITSTDLDDVEEPSMEEKVVALKNQHGFASTVSLLPGTTMGVLAQPLAAVLPASLADGIDARLMILDTPGIMKTQSSLLRLLELEEIKMVSPVSKIKPFRHNLLPGQSGLFAGLIRVDYVEGEHKANLMMSCFLKPTIPYFRMATTQVDAFYSENVGVFRSQPPHLQPPLASLEDTRLSRWPRMEVAAEFPFSSTHGTMAAKDIAIQGMGWIALSGFIGNGLIRIWTPAGTGIALRSPLYRFPWNPSKH